MKNIKFLFLLVATLFATAFTACQQEWEPGQPDSELCVYFPVDVNVAPFATVDSDDTVEIDETTTALFPVYRQNKGAQMTVEIRSRFVNPDAIVYQKTNSSGVVTAKYTVADAFTVAESVTFEEGENVAYIQIERSEDIKSMSVGSLYEIEVMIKDVKHQGNYGLSRKTFSVGIPETWRDLGDDQEDPELKLGSYTEDFFVWLYGVEGGNTVAVTIEESEARKGVYRMKNVFSQDNVVALLGGIPSDMQFASGDTYIIINASDPEKVYIPFQYAGIGIPGYLDQFWICSGRGIGEEDAKLEDGVISFAAKTVGLFDASGTSGYYSNPDGKMRITLPGVSIKDYSFGVVHSGTETSVDNSETRANFEFTVGKDISKYRFVIVDGNVNAYEQTKEVVGTDIIFHTVPHPVVTALLETNYVDGVADLTKIEDETIKAYLENSAESSASATTWYISMPEAGLYTMLAIPYNEKGEAVVDETGNAKAYKSLFYYNPANQDQVNVDTTIKSMNLKLGSVAEVMGNAQYEASYPSCFVLAFDVQSDDADLVTKLVWYQSESAKIPEGIDPTTEEGMKALIAMAGADSDISSQISSLKTGKSPMLIQATPDTEYTVVLAVSTLYGKTQYYSVTGKSTPYRFDWAFGTYEIVDGNSKMTIEFEPFYNSSYGLMFYMKWVVEDNAPDVKIREFPMVAFTESEWNAVVTYGQVNGYTGTFFAYDIDRWAGDPNKVWGFHSSSTSDYDYDYDSMVLYDTDKDGILDSLGTYFRQYIKTFVVNDKNETEVVTEYIKTFAPETTTVTLVDNKKPVVTSPVEPEQPEQGDENTGDENTGDEEQGAQPQAAKMGVSRTSKPAMLQMKKDVTFIPVSIK